MSDNVVKSGDLQPEKPKPAKKAPAKKAAAPKKEAETKEATASAEGNIIVVFESGAAYTSNEISFTREDWIKEVPTEIALRLLELDNFRIANPFEVEDFFNSKEG
jgi:hypothetical protein